MKPDVLASEFAHLPEAGRESQNISFFFFFFFF